MIGRILKWLAAGTLVAGVGAASYLWGGKVYTRLTGSAEAAAKQDHARFTRVKRDNLQILITEDGKLRAVKNHAIFPQLKGQSRIAWLIPEGTTVKKGDKLVEFDKKEREERLRTRQADLETAKRSVVVARETLKIQVSASKGTLKLAQTKLNDARVALRVYENLEAPKRINELDNAINDARTKYNDALKRMNESKQKLDEQMFTEDDQRKALENDLAAQKRTVDAVRKAVDTAIMQQKTFRRYDYPQALNAKKDAVANAELDLERAKVSSTSEVEQKQQEVRKVEDLIKRLERDIEELTTEIDNCVLVAPVEGIVLYGDPNRPYWYDSNERIRVGAEWYGSNTLMTIPDLSNFEVTIAIGEEYRGKLKQGCPASITIEAIPGLTLDGELKKIETLARNRIQWDPASPKVFDAIVTPHSNDDRMVSGMTTRVEIVAEVVPNVLLAPIEAVFNENGEPVCYVRKGEGSERRVVEPGKSNDHFVEIIKGLAEGEEIDLTPVRVVTSQGPTTQPATRPSTRPTSRPATQEAATQPSTQPTTLPVAATLPASTQPANN